MVGIRFGFKESLYPVLTSLPEGEALGDRQPKEQVFTSSGTWTHPGATSITHVDVLLVGGGGGGGGGAYSPGNFMGGAGGGGGVRRMSVPVSTSPGSYTVTIGAGGSSGPQGQNGGTGGDSSFGSSVYPALNPTSNVVGGGGLGRGGTEPGTGATLADAPAEGGGGGARAGRPSDGNRTTWSAPDAMGTRRAGRGGANGYPAQPEGSNASSGGAGSWGSADSDYLSGGGKFGYGGGGALKGYPAPNYWYWSLGATDGGGIGPTNPTNVTGPTGGTYPWFSGGVTNTGGGGGAGNSQSYIPTGPTLHQGGSGGSGICIVRWWE
jgi:hypothetical protein